MPLTFNNATNVVVGFWMEAGAHNPEVVLEPGESIAVDNVEGEVVFQLQTAPNVGANFDVTYLAANPPGFTLPQAGNVGVVRAITNLRVGNLQAGMLFVKQ
jgi:hypothetical protein